MADRLILATPLVYVSGLSVAAANGVHLPILAVTVRVECSSAELCFKGLGLPRIAENRLGVVWASTRFWLHAKHHLVS